MSRSQPLADGITTTRRAEKIKNSKKSLEKGEGGRKMALFKIKDSGDIRLELTMTLSIEDWEKLLSQLEKKNKEAMGWFCYFIKQLLSYTKNEKELDQGEINLEARYKIKKKDLGEIKIELTVSQFTDYWKSLLNNLIDRSPSGDLAYTIDQMLNDVKKGVWT